MLRIVLAGIRNYPRFSGYSRYPRVSPGFEEKTRDFCILALDAPAAIVNAGNLVEQKDEVCPGAELCCRFV